MKLSQFCILGLILCQGAAAQSPPPLTDDIIRRLGGDPEANREAARKRALESPTPEELAMLQRAKDMVETITAEEMSSLRSDDPVLAALYVYRVGVMEHPTRPWTKVIDNDLRQRKEAMQVIKSIFLTSRLPGTRPGVLQWLSEHLDVPWGESSWIMPSSSTAGIPKSGLIRKSTF